MAGDSLWPTEIRPNIQSPITILEAQAQALTRQTIGLLNGELTSQEVEGGRITVAFDIVVPTLDGYRHRILTVGYDKNMPYPALVDAEVFRPTGLTLFRNFLESGFLGSNIIIPANRAATDEEFFRLVEEVLKSNQVLSAAQSLIARANEEISSQKKLQALADPETEIGSKQRPQI